MGQNWAWGTPSRRAVEAYDKGDTTYEVTLEILQAGYQQTLDDIVSVGWRLDNQVKHSRVRTTDVTPQSDGSHEVVRTVTQQATFYFVRDDGPQKAWRPTPPATPVVSPPVVPPPVVPPPPPVPPPTSVPWPAGWYPTQHGQQWWDGTQWATPNPPQPTYDAMNYESGYTGFSNGEILLHLGLTFFTCGLWIPFWIGIARRRRQGR